ncbi:MAG: peptidylprolyl isomerase [Nitrospirae bacterium]|nr:peptidylprolyl isomerase [Nitrospirota bacterium]MBI3353022.1 peptidylprolyl isomerase [Nitrospirota bacterium]
MSKLSSKIVIYFFLGFFFWQAGLSFSRGDENKDEKKGNSTEQNREKVIAEVNGVPILEVTLKQEMRNSLINLGHGELPPQRMEEIRREVLDTLIARELVTQKAKKEGVDPNDLVKKEVYDKALVQEEEIKAYFEKHQEEFMKPEGVRLRHLLVSVDPSSFNEGWKRGYEKALELSERVKNGEDFESLVQKYSDPESKYFGGDLRIQYKGKMAMAEFDQVAFTLKEKEVSGPIQTLYGFSLIQVAEKIPPEPFPFREINQEKIKKKLVQEKVDKRTREWIGDLKSPAVIKIY